MSEVPNRPEIKRFEVPAAAGRALARVEKLQLQSKPYNTLELEDEFNQTLWWGTEPGSQAAEEQEQQRLQAHAWAIQELRAWTSQSPLAIYHLQIQLATLLISSPSNEDAVVAVLTEKLCPPFIEGLVMLMELTSISIPSRHRRLNFREQREETLSAGRNGDYQKLGNLIRHLEIELPPDIRLAILIIRRFAPEKLALQIEERQDVFFSIAVRDALSEELPIFSQLVNDVTFKFVCITPLANARRANAPAGSVEVIRELLLQVAQTDLWRTWLLDFVRYPQADSVATGALSEALIQLTPAHWDAFVDAVELWTYAGTSGSVAKILVPFLHALGDKKSSDMWRLAFERWDKWNYGDGEEDKQLHSPSVCSFDFPVAMHYALLPLEQVDAERVKLLQEILKAEEKWFSSFQDLITYRNRLSSRLRLVQHGLAIRNSPLGGTNALPPSIEPESEFAKFRYRFFDVSALNKRGVE
ncbi:MAG: hypothetical protein EOP06_04090 [Proteobacteria bacterium]|nr:MAG: hypothetical protein EOP06_04090 [Pseudomonadota bacterium]